MFFSCLSGESGCGGFAFKGDYIHESPSLPFLLPCCVDLVEIILASLQSDLGQCYWCFQVNSIILTI